MKLAEKFVYGIYFLKTQKKKDHFFGCMAERMVNHMPASFRIICLSEDEKKLNRAKNSSSQHQKRAFLFSPVGSGDKPG